MPGPQPPGRLAAALIVSGAIASSGGAAGAQDGLDLSFGRAAPGAGGAEAARRPGSLLVIDRDRVLAESGRGRALLAEIEAEGQALERENREIEGRLRDEESALTERRPEMDADAFRAEADAFDARVQEIRETQAEKGRALIARREADQRRFWDEAVPVLATILRERGAVVVLERDGVFLSSDSADITAEAIERLDAAERGGAPAGGGTHAPSGVSTGGDLGASPDEPVEAVEPPTVEPGPAGATPPRD